MNNGSDNRDLGQFDDLLSGLEELSETLDRERFPGHAWPVRRRFIRVVFRPLAAAAVAAAVIIVFFLLCGGDKPTGEGPSVPAPGLLASAPSPRENDWPIPASIDPSIAGCVSPQSDVAIQVPSVSIPSPTDMGGVEFSLPAISFPALQERTDENDS